jgi:helicase
MALHALFTDTLGGDTALLTDGDATAAVIAAQFDRLATSDADDIVVICFSGHGTEMHELVTHDTDPYDLVASTIPLTTLGEWCARIPARRLLIVLDCCFSGGMGAKALQVEGFPRDVQSVEGKLNQSAQRGQTTGCQALGDQCHAAFTPQRIGILRADAAHTNFHPHCHHVPARMV